MTQHNEMRWELERQQQESADKVIAEFRGKGWKINVRVNRNSNGEFVGNPDGPATCMYCGCLVSLMFSDVHRQRCQPIVG